MKAVIDMTAKQVSEKYEHQIQSLEGRLQAIVAARAKLVEAHTSAQDVDSISGANAGPRQDNELEQEQDIMLNRRTWTRHKL